MNVDSSGFCVCAGLNIEVDRILEIACIITDGKSLDIVGRGDIDIKTSSGSLWTLHNVKHIPALKRNLISIGQLDDEGLYTTFGDGSWKVIKGSLIMARGKKRGSLYMIVDEDMVVVTEAVIIQPYDIKDLDT